LARCCCRLAGSAAIRRGVTGSTLGFYASATLAAALLALDL
jgi:hypothetical protein